MNYKKKKILGKGSYGIVFLIEDTNKKLYALKKMSYKKNFVKACHNELNILRKINSNFVINVYNYYKKKDFFYIIMEYGINGDLRNFISKNKYISEKTFRKIGLSINRGLKDLHSIGIIHRDIKPSNILICRNNVIKITDFGISKITNNQYAETKIGTPYYMSPEIINGKTYSFYVDYWSLGCILYELLAKKKPFNSNSLHMLYIKISRSKIDINSIPFKFRKLINGLLERLNYIRYKYSDVKKILFDDSFKRKKNKKNYAYKVKP